MIRLPLRDMNVLRREPERLRRIAHLREGSHVNRYSHLGEPQDTLDFHEHERLKGADVKRETLRFVRAACERGLDRVRIVTGKGLHSAGRPVVRPQVERTLRVLEKEGLVESYRSEKVGRGDEGALFVRLVPR